MRLWTCAPLGVAAVVFCAGSAAAQTPGCAACAGKPLAAGVPNKIPHCNKHSGLTQYPWSEKRYIKQFCGPTICPNSCFGHFKTQWTPWGGACPSWPVDADTGPAPAAYVPPPAAVEPPAAKPEAPKVEAPKVEAPKVDVPKADPLPAAPPSKPLPLPTPKADVPTPMPTIPKLPDPTPPGRF